MNGHDITDPMAPLGYQCGDAGCREHGLRSFYRDVVIHEDAMDALRDAVDPDEDPRCVDCGVEVDGLGPPICRECADVED